MDFRHLSHFIAVYESGSLSAGARQLGISQPSLSQSIITLEASLKTTLFVRIPKGVTPTTEGEKLYLHACNLIGQLQAVRSSFVQRPKKSKFKLGLIHALGTDRMAWLLKEFQNLCAVNQLELELVLVAPDSECDARIITTKQLKSGELFTPIWQDNYVIALNSHSPLSLKTQLSAQDFADLPLIRRLPCEAWRHLEAVLLKAKVKPDIRADIQTIEYALALVSTGIGAALVPDFTQLKSRPDLCLKELGDFSVQREIGLAHRRDGHHPLMPFLQAACLSAKTAYL